MSAFKPPSGRASRSEVRTLSSASESNAVGTSQPKRQNSFSGRSRRLSNGGRETPVTGERNVNRIIGNLNLSIKTTSAGRMGLLIGNAQSELEALQTEARDEVIKETKKLKNMESRGKTPINVINEQRSRVKKAEKKLNEVESAIEKAVESAIEKDVESKTPKRIRNNNTTVESIKRTRSTEGPPTITTKPPSTARKSTPKTKSVNFLTQLKNATGKVNRSKETVVESQAPTRTNSLSNIKMGPARSLFPNNEPPTSSEGSNIKPKTTTPTNQTIPTATNPPPIKKQHKEAKRAGAKRASNERREEWEREGPPRARRSLEPIFNQIAKQKNTPPGITKTNLERLFQPFKQPVTVTVAPTISVRGGSAQATGGYVKQMVVGPKTKDTKPKKPNFLRKPESIRRETIAATKRQEIMSRIRTPTEGQRKKHIIQLIDRVLTKMKVPKYIQKNMMAIYTKSLSERQIKTLFAGKSKEEIKTILKKQVETLKKKR